MAPWIFAYCWCILDFKAISPHPLNILFGGNPNHHSFSLNVTQPWSLLHTDVKSSRSDSHCEMGCYPPVVLLHEPGLTGTQVPSVLQLRYSLKLNSLMSAFIKQKRIACRERSTHSLPIASKEWHRSPLPVLSTILDWRGIQGMQNPYHWMLWEEWALITAKASVAPDSWDSVHGKATQCGWP